MALILVGFGWAKPVPVDPSRFRNPPMHMAIVAAAGPISNLLLALFGVIVYRISVFVAPWALPAVDTFIWLNVILAVFNMIPLPPLDGWRVLQGFNPSLYWDLNVYACPYRSLTGIPDGGCGTYRSIMALIQGDILKSLYWNPLTLVSLLVILLFPFIGHKYRVRALTLLIFLYLMLTFVRLFMHLKGWHIPYIYPEDL